MGRKITQLKINKKESTIVNDIFDFHLKSDSSIKKVKAYLDDKNIKSKKGANFSLSMISRILDNPVYVFADKTAFEYFSSLGCIMDCSKEEFDGTKGIIRYNYTDTRTRNTNPPEKWIISVSKVHEGLISGEKFLDV